MKCWNKAIEKLSGGTRVDDLRWTYCENLTKTFKSVNKFMGDINQTQFKEICDRIKDSNQK